MSYDFTILKTNEEKCMQPFLINTNSNYMKDWQLLSPYVPGTMLKHIILTQTHAILQMRQLKTQRSYITRPRGYIYVTQVVSPEETIVQ